MGRSHNAVKVVTTVVVVAFLGATAGLLAVSSGGGGDPPESLSKEGEELLALLDRRDEATYHAKYEATAPGTQQLALETWQSPPKVRQDSEIRSGGQLVRARVLVNDRSRVRCTQLKESAWQCRPAGGNDGSTDPLASFRQRIGQGTVTATDASIDGRKVRCFDLTTADGTSQLCVVPDSGIPVRVEGGGTNLRLVRLDETVDPGLFEPPAPVVSS